MTTKSANTADDREFVAELERLAGRVVDGIFERARARRVAAIERALQEEQEEPLLRLIRGGGGP